MTNEVKENRLSPQARGERVRKLRNMANLTRQQMCEKSDFKIDTLVGWENGRHGGLTERGAQKILARVVQEGVICTAEWLLNEEGAGPTVFTNFASSTTNLVPDSEEQKIFEEILLLKKHYSGVIDYQITDNAMSPTYHQGDHVAGIKCAQDKWNTLIGHHCIVKLLNGEMLVRKVCKGKDSYCYTLIPVDLGSDPNALILADVKFTLAAPVIWHRKKLAGYECFKKEQ